MIEAASDRSAPTPPTTAARDLAISVNDLSKRYAIERVAGRVPHASLRAGLMRLLGRGRPAPGGSDELWALDGLTFDIERGERVAVIGRNGAGKTTLLKILSRIALPTRGEARIRGRLTSLLEVGTGFQGQLTGRENVFVNASMHGLTRKETAERFDRIVELSGLDRRFLDMRVKHYSSGMRVRLAFSVAAHLDPDVLLLDEVLAVGDIAFQEKCLERVEGMLRQKRTVVLVSHDMGSVTRYCERAIWLEQGKVVLDGPAREVAAAYTKEVRRAVTARRWTPADAAPPASVPARATAAEPEPAAPRLGPDGTIAEEPWARFLGVALVDPDRRDLVATSVHQRFGIELAYEIQRAGKLILPAAIFFAPDGVRMFTAVDTDPDDMRQPKAPGCYRSVVWIPPHLLAPGVVEVTVSLTTPTSGKLERHAVCEKVLRFEVFEAPLGVPSARGSYREVKGVVRPLLEWETRKAEGGT